METTKVTTKNDKKLKPKRLTKFQQTDYELLTPTEQRILTTLNSFRYATIYDLALLLQKSYNAVENGLKKLITNQLVLVQGAPDYYHRSNAPKRINVNQLFVYKPQRVFSLSTRSLYFFRKHLNNNSVAYNKRLHQLEHELGILRFYLFLQVVVGINPQTVQTDYDIRKASSLKSNKRQIHRPDLLFTVNQHQYLLEFERTRKHGVKGKQAFQQNMQDNAFFHPETDQIWLIPYNRQTVRQGIRHDVLQQRKQLTKHIFIINFQLINDYIFLLSHKVANPKTFTKMGKGSFAKVLQELTPKIFMLAKAFQTHAFNQEHEYF